VTAQAELASIQRDLELLDVVWVVAGHALDHAWDDRVVVLPERSDRVVVASGAGLYWVYSVAVEAGDVEEKS
jgi:hypothetical protein